MNPVRNLLHKIDNKNLNILTFPTHERYETNLSKTGFNFFAFRQDGIKYWNTDYAPLPENYTILDETLGEAQIPSWLNIDLILSQNKFGQIQVSKHLVKKLQVPILSLEHTLPIPGWSAQMVEEITANGGHKNVYISEYSMKKWGGSGEVIHHGIDTNTFVNQGKQRKGNITVVNDFINRDLFCGYKIWEKVTVNTNRNVLGNTPGLSSPAESVDDLVNSYNSHLVYVNTSTVSPIPTALLEAMACGCCPVSTATCMIPEIITDGVNGFISNDESVLRAHIERLEQNPEEAIEIGKRARRFVVEKFGLDKFVENWRNTMLEAAQIPYRGEF